MTAFEPPGNGEWRSFAEHLPHPIPRVFEQLFIDTIADGMGRAFVRYGIPVKTITLRFVHGHAYLAPAPLMESKGRALPPKPILWVAARVHPEFRRREKAARNALATRIWRQDTARWFDELRDVWIERNRVLQAVDPAGLADDELAVHTRECFDNVIAGYTQHFELHSPDMLPAGMLLARAADWGLDHRLLSAALAGASPVSRGEDERIARLRTCVEQAGATPSTLDEVRAIGPDAAATLDSYLDDCGWRMVTTYDPSGLALREMPALLLQLILVAARVDVDEARAEAATAELRAAVPAADRAEFDNLLAEVKVTCALRDDNGQFTGAWPVGLLRRALLECGRRLAASAALADAAHVMDLEVDETTALLTGASAPRAADVAARATLRAENDKLVPPERLGTPEPEPPFELLPDGIATMARALVATLEGMATESGPSDGALHGTGIGHDTYRGRAVVAHQPDEAIERLEPGDVLVAMFTTPAYNAVLPLAGALVVEAGGVLSHAAVMARELELPAVIGAAGAMSTITDGDTVEVDPIAGSVRVVQTSAAGARGA